MPSIIMPHASLKKPEKSDSARDSDGALDSDSRRDSNSSRDVHVEVNDDEDNSPASLLQPVISWIHLPTEHVARESLWLSGIVLLITGVASCFLCFYLFDHLGETYYLDMGITSSLVTIMLGILAVRSSQWEWFPNHLTVAGFLYISCLKLIHCSLMSVMAYLWEPYHLTDITDLAGGFTAALSIVIMFLSSIGFLCVCMV